MANGNDLTGPTLGGIELTQQPLGQDMLPEKVTGPSLADVKMPDAPVLSGIPDIVEFTPEQSRQRNIARKYGVDPGPGINVQESAAMLQSNLSKWTNGVLKGVGTGLTTFAEPFVDLFVGTPTAISTGKFSGFYNNEGSKALDEFNEFLRQELPNYYTQAERDYGFWRSLGTANFWADQGMQGLGFLAGAIASGYAVGASGAIKMGVRGAGMGGVRAWRNLTNTFRGQQLAGAKTAKSIDNVKNIIGRVNYSAEAANMFGAGLISAFGEAGIEARETRRRSIATMQNLRSTGDERYANMSDLEIQELADTAGNIAFGLNTAIVGASNIYQFGKLFSRSWKSTSSKYLDDITQKKMVDGKLRYGAKEMSDNWKKYYGVVNWFKRPAAEAFEEWSQAAVNVAAEDYFTDVYSSNPIEDMTDMLEGGVGVIGSLMRGYMEAPQTKEGQQAIFLGALLGKLGEAGAAVREDGMTSRQEWLDKYERSVALSEKLNLLEPESKLYRLLKSYNEGAIAQAKMDKALEDGDIFKYKNAEAQAVFSLVDEFINAGKIEDLKSFVKDIGGLSEDAFKEVVGLNPETKVKSPAEQARIIEDRIKFIENQKPKVDLFVSTLNNVTDQEKILIDAGIRYYSYMIDVADKREIELSQELADITDGLVSWQALQGIKGKSAELAKALTDMKNAFESSDSYTDMKGQEAYLKLQDLAKLAALKEEHYKLLNAVTETETLSKIARDIKKKERKAKQDKKKAEAIKSEVVKGQEDDVIEAVEDNVETKANDRVKRREQIGTKRQRKLMRRKQALEDQLAVTPEEEKATIQAAIDEITQAIQAKAETVKEQVEADIEKTFEEAFPKTKETKEQEDELQRLIEAEERGVDLETTENLLIGNLLSYPNATVSVRFNGEEGILFKEEDGTVVFQNTEGQETEVGKFLDAQTLSEVGVEALQDQISPIAINIIADGRTFEIGGQYYNNLFINPLSAIDPFVFRIAQEGFEPKRVTLFDSDGNKVTFTNPFLVQELSRLITMVELVKQEAITEMQEFNPGLMEFEFQGETYYVEDVIEDEKPNVIVYNKKLNRLRAPKKIAQVLRARDVFIDNYIQNKINAYINEYEEDLYGTQPDATTESRSEEEVKRDAQEASSERVSPKDIGDDTPTPDKTDKQASINPETGEIVPGFEVMSQEEIDALIGEPFSDSGINIENDTNAIPGTEVVTEAAAPIINTEESKDAVNDVVEEQEIPDNSTVRTSNFESNKNGSNVLGYEVVALSTIQSLAWKSANHPDNDGIDVDQVVKDLTDVLESGIDRTGTALEFSIDLNDPQLTDIREMAPILAKLKKGIRLTEDEIAKVAMRVSMNIDGKKVYAYIHRLDYVDNHIKPEEQEAARKMLMADRTKIYEDFLAGRKTKSTIKEMTGGHLVTERGAKTYVDNLLSFDKKPLSFFIAANGVYIDENGENGFRGEEYIANTEQDGAIFTSVLMANGQRFPLRLFVENLSEETAALIYSIYGEALTSHNGNINKNMPIKAFNNLKNRSKDVAIVAEFLNIVESTMESKEVGPTYKQMLDMLIFHGAKTKSKVSPTIVSGKGKLRLGDVEISTKDFRARSREIIDWLKANKRHHVSKNYMNSKTNGNYNKWLVSNRIVYTDATPRIVEPIGLSEGMVFIQPTLRYAPLKSEAPAAKKESVSPNQVSISSEKAEIERLKQEIEKIENMPVSDKPNITGPGERGYPGSLQDKIYINQINAKKERIKELSNPEFKKKENFAKEQGFTDWKHVINSLNKREGKPSGTLRTVDRFLKLTEADILQLASQSESVKAAKASREKESPKPIQPKKDLTQMSGGFQEGITSADLAGMGVDINAILGGGTSFNIDADLGPAAPSKTSDITKSQDKNNCE